MDMMEIRRQMMGVIAGMASGAQFEKGSFTVPSSGSTYTLNFGKAFSKYLFFIEADDDAIDTIIDTGTNANKAYAFFGLYPNTEVGNAANTYNTYMQRVNPSTNAFSNTGIQLTMTGTSITFSSGALSSNMQLFQNLTYNYYICEIK